jgi:hypothetical protein
LFYSLIHVRMSFSGSVSAAQLITSANEIRRVLTALCGPPPDEQHARHWSRWRQHHQERARYCHYQQQYRQDLEVRREC